MQITEVRIKLMDDPGERLQAFCSITFDDCFVVRDLKIIDGSNGPFVAMPSRKLTSHCPRCGCKNHLRASYCNQCGARLGDDQAARDDDGRAKLYADIAHPINSSCREMIQDRVIEAFEAELRDSQQPGYVSKYDDFDEDEPVAPSTSAAESTTAEEPAEAEAPPPEAATTEAATPEATTPEAATPEQDTTEAKPQPARPQPAETRKPAAAPARTEESQPPRGPHKTPTKKGAAPWRPAPPKSFGEGIF